MTIIDLTQSPTTILLNLLNNTIGVELSLEDIVFELPVAIPQTEDTVSVVSPLNTSVPTISVIGVNSPFITSLIPPSITVTGIFGLCSEEPVFEKPFTDYDKSVNTTIVITGAPGSIYTGNVMIGYNRISLSDIPNDRSTEFSINSDMMSSDLISEINAAYNINLQPEDYVDFDLPDILGTWQSTTFLLQATEESYVYTGTLLLTLLVNC